MGQKRPIFGNVTYNVDGEPAAWANAPAASRKRWIYFAGAMFIAASFMTIQAWRLGQPVITGAACIAFLCFVYVTSVGLRPGRDDGATPGLVSDELDRLRHERYVVVDNLGLGGEGSLDHLVSGPTGVFLVETKFDRYEAEVLPEIKHQAARVAEELDCWVTPVICAGVQSKTFTQERVLVTGRTNLADAILAYPALTQVDPDKLARFAARFG